MSMSEEERAGLLAAATAALNAQRTMTFRPEEILRLLDALAVAGHQRDAAMDVVENIQGKVAMYAGKYETLARKIKAMRDAQTRYVHTEKPEDFSAKQSLERDVDELLKDIAPGIPVKHIRGES